MKIFRVQVCRKVHDEMAQWVTVEADDQAAAEAAALRRVEEDDDFWHDAKCYSLDSDPPYTDEVEEEA